MPLCPVCHSTAHYCDCVIAKMTPKERIDKQVEIMALYEAALDAREFERREVAKPLRRTVHGQFGNSKAKTKKKVRVVA